MFYLTTHSTHFIYSYMASDIWYRTIQIAREETRCRHIGYSFRLAARFFYMHHPTDRITHTTAFVTPVVEHWLEREIAQWVCRIEPPRWTCHWAGFSFIWTCTPRLVYQIPSAYERSLAFLFRFGFFFLFFLLFFRREQNFIHSEHHRCYIRDG